MVSKFADYYFNICLDVDECLASPGLNNGSCINEFGNCTCNCSSAVGYFGTNCEKGEFSFLFRPLEFIR